MIRRNSPSDPAQGAGRVGQLGRTEHDQRDHEEQDQLLRSDVEHAAESIGGAGFRGLGRTGRTSSPTATTAGPASATGRRRTARSASSSAASRRVAAMQRPDRGGGHRQRDATTAPRSLPLLDRRPAGHTLEPSLLLELEVELEEVVVGDRRPGSGFVELGRQLPDRHPDARGRPAGRRCAGSAGLVTAIWQIGAAEEVRALVVGRADPHLDVPRRQLDVATGRAARSDGRHRILPSVYRSLSYRRPRSEG